jgi:hypothetical protein
MKTIEISDEMYEALVKLSKDFKEQDNRGTASPYMYQLRDKKTIPSHSDYTDLFIWQEGGGECIYHSIDEVRERLAEYYDNDDFKNQEKFNDTEIEEIAESKLEIKRTYYIEEDVIENVFFTLNALEKHLNSNGHHYKKPFSYVGYYFRNPELELIQKFITSL